MKILYLNGLLVFYIKTNLTTPFYFIRINLPVIKVSLFNVIHTVSTCDRWSLRKVILRCLVFLNRFFLFLHLKCVLFLSYTVIRNIDTMMVEKFTKWSEICRIHKRAKATTDCMRIDPLVILFTKSFLWEFIEEIIILILNSLKISPFFLKNLSFKQRCSFYAFVAKFVQLLTLPKRQNINVFTEKFCHVVPNIIRVFFLMQIKQIGN